MFAIFPFFMTPKTFWPISDIEESFEECESFLLQAVRVGQKILVVIECWDNVSYADIKDEQEIFELDEL